jgi:hypothetical protein
MRKPIKILGTFLGIGTAVVTGLGRFSNLLGILGLPDEVKEALVLMSGAPTIVPVVALLIGLFCAGYLVYDSGHHTLALALLKKRTIRVYPYLIPIGLVLIAIGGIVVGIGAWQKPKQVEVRSFGFSSTPALSPELLLPDDGGPIKWVRGVYFLNISSSPNGWVIGGFQMVGQSESDEFLGPISGFVRSEITGRQVNLQIDDDKGKYVPLDGGYGIPARNQFHLFAPFGEQIKISDFLRDFARLTFVFQYGTHTYTKRFSPDEIQKEVRRTEEFLEPKSPESKVGARPMPPKAVQ